MDLQKEINRWDSRAAAIIVENECVFSACNEKDDYFYSIGGGVHSALENRQKMQCVGKFLKKQEFIMR